MSASRFVEANGTRLHFLDYPGEGPVLVLTHGLTANARFFDGLVQAGLAPALHVLSFDLRGRGLSEKPERGYSMEDHAADLLGALDALGIDRVALGGHSFGGLLTLYVAAAAPERVERALVLDVPAEVDATVLEQIGPSLARLDQTYPSRAAYLEFVRELPYFADGGWNACLAALYDAELEELPDGTVRSGCRPEHIRQGGRDARARLAGDRRECGVSDAPPADDGSIRASRIAADHERGRCPSDAGATAPGLPRGGARKPRHLRLRASRAACRGRAAHLRAR